MGLPSELVVLHDTVTGRVKEYEQRTGKNPPIEVLNELRYAFRGLVEWCSGQGSPEDALQHMRHGLMCAYHDLVDGLLIEFSRQLDSAIENYPDSTVKVLGSKRLEMLDVINRVEGKVAASRKDRDKRATIYEAIYDKFDILAEQIRFFDQIALPNIITEADRATARLNAAKRDKNIALLIGVVGIILAVIGFMG